MSETWQLSKKRNVCCSQEKGNWLRTQFKSFCNIAGTLLVAEGSGPLKCNSVSLVESFLAFRRFVILLWLQVTLKIKVTRFPETSGTTRLTSQRHMSDLSLQNDLCENVKSRILWLSLVLANCQTLEANDSPFGCSEYYWFHLLVKFKTPLITSSWSNKCHKVGPDRISASAVNNLRDFVSWGGRVTAPEAGDTIKCVLSYVLRF
jgi:hypothetical protein